MPFRTQETAPPPKKTRRSFLNILWALLGGIALAELFAVAFAFLQPRNTKLTREKKEAMVTAGAVERFKPNSVTAFVKGKFYLTRLADGGFLAISRTCTHLGCSVPWMAKEMKFVCPCHGSTFDITGNVIDAPAPRALDIYPITIENQRITVDTYKPIKRSQFIAEQVAYPKINA
jgi:cytochrome b6-f complex iron-sulfur subunit